MVGCFYYLPMVICASHPHHWFGLLKYKLLIIPTAWHSPGHLWLRVTLPSTWLWRHLVHQIINEFGPQQFTSVHELHPRPCRRPLACPYQHQPTGETVPSAFGSSCNRDKPGVCYPFRSPGTFCFCSPSPAMIRLQQCTF